MRFESLLMQTFHYLFLYFSLILSDENLGKLLAYFYLYPMSFYMLLSSLMCDEEADIGVRMRNRRQVQKMAFHYSSLAISIVIGLVIVDYCSLYDLLILLPLLLGFPFVNILDRYKQKYSSRRAYFGMTIFTLLFAFSFGIGAPNGSEFGIISDIIAKLFFVSFLFLWIFFMKMIIYWQRNS